MRTAIVKINAELLRQALHLPDDVQIVDAIVEFDCLGVISLRLEGPQFAEVAPGNRIPRMVAEFMTAPVRESKFVRFV